MRIWYLHEKPWNLPPRIVRTTIKFFLDKDYTWYSNKCLWKWCTISIIGSHLVMRPKYTFTRWWKVAINLMFHLFKNNSIFFVWWERDFLFIYFYHASFSLLKICTCDQFYLSPIGWVNSLIETKTITQPICYCACGFVCYLLLRP